MFRFSVLRTVFVKQSVVQVCSAVLHNIPYCIQIVSEATFNRSDKLKTTGLAKVWNTNNRCMYITSIVSDILMIYESLEK